MEKKGIKICELPGEERPRERLMRQGVRTLSNAELLAILISSGVNQSSAMELASKLLTIDQEGIGFLANCEPEEILNVRGIGQAKACRIISAIELGKRVAARSQGGKPSVNTSEAVANMLMEDMRYLKKEHFKVVLLNVKNQVITVDLVAVGGLSSAKIHPREVFSNAVKKSAASLVLAHNHPSGNPIPSEQDVLLTKRLQEAGRILGIEVVDHIVIGDGVYHSMRANYLME